MRELDTFRLKKVLELEDLLSFEVVNRNLVKDSPFCSVSSSRLYIVSLGGYLGGSLKGRGLTRMANVSVLR